MNEIQIKANSVYRNMLNRCYNKKVSSYKNYGGRGISVCEMWKNDRLAFLQWYLDNYFPGGEVDRIDNNGNYSPENCRMVTKLQNVSNRRITKRVEFNGESKTVREWEADERVSVSYETIQRRLTLEWPIEDALFMPPRNTQRPGVYTKGVHKDDPVFTAFGETKTLAAWCRDPRCVVNKKLANMRYKQMGWDFEKAISTPARKITKNKNV